MPTHFNTFREWKQFGQKLNALAVAKDYRGMALVYYESADFLESHGKDASDVRGQGYRMMLKVRLKEIECMREFDPQMKLKIIAAPDACGLCVRQSGKVITLQEAQSQRVLPVKGCDRKHGCRCIYAPQLESRHGGEWVDIVRH